MLSIPIALYIGKDGDLFKISMGEKLFEVVHGKPLLLVRMCLVVLESLHLYSPNTTFPSINIIFTQCSPVIVEAKTNGKEGRIDNESSKIKRNRYIQDSWCSPSMFATRSNIANIIIFGVVKLESGTTVI